MFGTRTTPHLQLLVGFAIQRLSLTGSSQPCERHLCFIVELIFVYHYLTGSSPTCEDEYYDPSTGYYYYLMLYSGTHIYSTDTSSRQLCQAFKQFDSVIREYYGTAFYFLRLLKLLLMNKDREVFNFWNLY